MDWATIGLNTSTQNGGSVSLKIALHNTTNTTAYSAVAGATSYAMDELTFEIPAATATARTASITRASNGWNGRHSGWCRRTIS